MKQQFVRYLLVGGGAAALDFLVFQGLYHVLRGQWTGGWLLAEQWANSAGMLCGFLYTFFVNRAWTFRSRGRVQSQLLLAVALLGFNIVLGGWLIARLINDFDWPPALAKIVLQGSVVVWNFFIFKYLIYGDDHAKQN